MNDPEHRAAPQVDFAFGHEPGAPKQARSALEPLFDDPDDPIAEAVQLAASELVSNVVQHTDDGGRMQAWDPKPDIPLRLEVEDDDREDPIGGHESRQSGGRGLGVVDAVADDWGVYPTVRGKIVWAEFNRPPNDEDTAADVAAGTSPNED